MRYAEALLRLDQIAAHIISVTETLPIIPINQKELTRTFYNSLIANLRVAMSGYMADRTNKESHARMLIMSMYNTVIMENFVCEGFDPTQVTGTQPGFSDIRELYSCDSVFSILIDSPISNFYQGPITAEPVPVVDELMPGEYVLHDLRLRAEKAEQTDGNKRLALHHWVNSFNMTNSFAILFEGFAGSININTPSIVTGIYTDRHFLEVIAEYDLNVYIPTYLRS